VRTFLLAEAVTRRDLLRSLPIVGAFLPVTHSAAGVTQFEVTGHFTAAGADHHLAYYALGGSLSLMLDPAKLPAMVAQCDKLVGKQVRIRLEEA
jgi:hypothetical protein